MVSSVATLSCALLFAAEALASCAHGTSLHPRQEGEVEVNNFGYSALTGPLNWVALDPANILCATGSNQSPIDMVEGQFSLVSAADLGITIPDFTEGTEFENLGTTVEVIAQGGTMAVNNVEFGLQQFHFHLPSEHLDAGVSHAMEMHMVWESAAGDVAVVGVYIDVENSDGAAEDVVEEPAETSAEETVVAEETVATEAEAEATAAETEAEVEDTAAATEGEAEATAAARKRSVRTVLRDRAEPAPKAKPAEKKKRAATTLLETVFSSVGAITEPGTVTTTEPLVMSELVDLINAGDLQNYAGSLTTPPCSEGVTWFVSTQKLQVTAESFGRVRDVIGFNARFPQNTLGQPNLLAVAGATMASPHVQLAAVAQRIGVH